MKLIKPIDASYHSPHSPTKVTLMSRPWVSVVYGKRALRCEAAGEFLGVIFPRRKRWHAIHYGVDSDYTTQGEAIEALITAHKQQEVHNVG